MTKSNKSHTFPENSESSASPENEQSREFLKSVEDSANSKTNAYYHHCEYVGCARAYAACLHMIRTRESGKLPAMFSDCDNAIKRGNCQAVPMRDRELTQGKALYFIPRASPELVRVSNESITLIGRIGGVVSSAIDMIPGAPRGDKGKVPCELKVAAVKGREKVGDIELDATSYADALSAAAGALAEKTVPVVAPARPVQNINQAPRVTAPMVAQQGETPLQMARRLMQQNQVRSA
jgi:hypothetical protein